jgi:hypothetical protein
MAMQAGETYWMTPAQVAVDDHVLGVLGQLAEARLAADGGGVGLGHALQHLKRRWRWIEATGRLMKIAVARNSCSTIAWSCDRSAGG